MSERYTSLATLAQQYPRSIKPYPEKLLGQKAGKMPHQNQEAANIFIVSRLRRYSPARNHQDPPGLFPSYLHPLNKECNIPHPSYRWSAASWRGTELPHGLLCMGTAYGQHGTFGHGNGPRHFPYGDSIWGFPYGEIGIYKPG